MYSQSQLDQLNTIICDNLEILLNELHLDLEVKNNKIEGCCPVHGGDNPGALSIYLDGYKVRGRWLCRTHHCEKEFQNTMIGFTRGVITKHKTNITFPQTVSSLMNWYGIKALKQECVEVVEKKDGWYKSISHSRAK